MRRAGNHACPSLKTLNGGSRIIQNDAPSLLVNDIIQKTDLLLSR